MSVLYFQQIMIKKTFALTSALMLFASVFAFCPCLHASVSSALQIQKSHSGCAQNQCKHDCKIELNASAVDRDTLSKSISSQHLPSWVVKNEETLFIYAEKVLQPPQKITQAVSPPELYLKFSTLLI